MRVQVLGETLVGIPWLIEMIAQKERPMRPNAFSTTSNLTQNQTFMFTFNTAGTFAYHCNIHTYMKATITVTA